MNTSAASSTPAAIARGFLLEAVVAQAPRDERIVERPHGPDVIADRVVPPFADGQRPYAPPAEQAVAQRDDGRRLSPSTCRRCRSTTSGRCSTRARRPCSRRGRVPSAKYSTVLDPEVAVEPAFETGRVLLQLVGERGVIPERARQARAPHLRVVRVALELARRAREAREPAVAERDGVPGVFPALVLEAGLLVAALVPDVAVAEEIGVLVDPVQGGARLVLEFAYELGVTGPALVLVEQHDVQRRGIRRPEVGGVRTFLERGHLAVPHLVQDASGVFVAEVVEAAALARAELVQRGRREFGCERQRLQTREDAVAAEHRHEPRQPRGRQAPSARGDRREPERGEVDEAPVVRGLQRLPVAFEARRVVEPLLEVSFHVRARLALAAPVLGRGCADRPSRRPRSRPSARSTTSRAARSGR